MNMDTEGQPAAPSAVDELPNLEQPKKFTFEQFESLAREMDLSLEQKELLASRCIDMGCLDPEYLSE